MTIESTKIVDLTRQMVEIPSVVGRYGESLEVLNLADKYLDGAPGLKSRTFERVSQKTGQKFVSRLWGSNETMLNPKVLLSGHIDVVEAERSMFKIKEKDGRLYGRGTGDMKGHVAAELVAYRRWVIEQGNPNGVGLLLTSDEEVGGENGARYIVEFEGLRPSVVFIPDGEFDFDIVDSQKAPHHFHVQALSTTKGGHVSKAFELDNPVNKILAVYQEMRQKYSLATKDDDWKSTFEMTVITTGNGEHEGRVINSANQIPEVAEAWFGWRWPVEVEIDGQMPSFDRGYEDLEEISKRHGVSILGGHGNGEGCYTDPNAEFVKKWKVIIEDVIDKKVGFKHMHGATDGRHFALFGSQVLVTSAITGSHHKADEWIDINSLAKLSEVVYKYQVEMTK
ncbi:MAG: M20/M25/M40 family metallo-hydrolase [Patescibacteria group bacterium]